MNTPDVIFTICVVAISVGIIGLIQFVAIKTDDGTDED